ncbi:nucleotide-binding universal stress UspA family protein [Natronospira proteinivora]|uniref:Nucleotide-binding universal stress UspA family protein n=1 Tax=Natronospira proteinivora TaxID=1807133 RepID=A0ABT1G6E1_9GAMM|nr:universal stress protein [Natronospira proteinivora]MCP1726657.1 nucleotide-binding universal stress UspA family protein [Natronospira proteinivora]
MYESALIAVDFSRSSLPMLKRLGYMERMGVKKVVLAHTKPTASGSGGDGPKLSSKELKEKLAEHAEVLAGQFEVETRLMSGDPVEQILTLAKDEDLDLIVTGSRAHSPAKRLLIGSTASGLVRKADRPLLLEDVRDADEGEDNVPRRDGPTLLATDGSSAAEAAEKDALQMLGKDKHLRVITVSSSNDIARAWRRLERITESAEKAGVRLVRSVDLGRAEHVIPQIAAAERASLIITGRRGREGVRGVRVGSTAENICRNANRPVLLVPGKEQKG